MVVRGGEKFDYRDDPHPTTPPTIPTIFFMQSFKKTRVINYAAAVYWIGFVTQLLEF